MVAVVVPTYNEAGNIKILLEKIDAIVPLQSKIIIVDDNSADGTAQLAKSVSTKNSTVYVISRSGKNGLGTALKEGITHALANNFEFIITMDADLSHNPSTIESMIHKSKEINSDIIVGSRYVKTGLNRGTFDRLWISKISNLLLALLLRINCKDATSGFRLYPKVALQSINLDSIESKGYSFQWELLHKLSMAGFGSTEIPIDFGQRYKGKSKLDLKEMKSSIIMLMTYSFKNLLRKKINRNANNNG